jgi:hypothetical protein
VPVRRRSARRATAASAGAGGRCRVQATGTGPEARPGAARAGPGLVTIIMTMMAQACSPAWHHRRVESSLAASEGGCPGRPGPPRPSQ